jgi:GNAT superfamily N-acetyltransferase
MLESVLAKIEEHARLVASRTRETVDVGPFVALLGADDDPWLSWAVPRGSLGPSRELTAPLAELARLFAARGRRLRVEFAAALHPQLPEALREAGLAPELELPLLACAPAGFRPRPHRDVRARWFAPGDDPAFLGSLMKRGFEAPGRIEPEELDRIVAGAASGTRYAIAEHTGLPAASGCSSPAASVTEIAAVSTLPTMRRRGAAAALVGFMTAAHFDAGGTLAWCTAGDDAAYGLFSSLGFDDLGVRMSWSAAADPEDPAARQG